MLLLGCAAAEELAAGAKGEAVERLQQRLYYLGFLSIQPDGDYGPKTVEAVTDFQAFFRARGYDLRGDGVADEATQALLFDDEVADADYPSRRATKTATCAAPSAASSTWATSSAPPMALRPEHRRRRARLPADAHRQRRGGRHRHGEADETTLHYLYSELLGFDICTPTMYNDRNPLSLRAGNLYAQAAVLIDAGSGEVLLDKNASERMYPASTTKIMTLLLGLERADFRRDRHHALLRRSGARRFLAHARGSRASACAIRTCSTA